MGLAGADLIREARKRVGLTQRELAGRTTTTQSKVARDRRVAALAAALADDFVPERILGVLVEHEVAFVLIGGLAAEISWDLTTPFGDLDIAFAPAGSTGYGSPP